MFIFHYFLSPRKMKLPRINARQMISVLQKLGFKLSRQSGSYKIFKNESGVRVTVPFHAGKILHLKIVKSVLRDCDLSVERFLEML
jgi:predicted RNA binding protein YcfA (HicA-like mRNA interferase family)